MRKIIPKQDEYAVGGETPRSMKTKKSEPRYPKFSIELEHIPEARKWDICKPGKSSGKYYIIEMKVKMIGLSQSSFRDDADFEIHEIETESVAKEKTEEGKDGTDTETSEDEKEEK